MDERILVTQSSMPSYEEFIEAIKPLWDTHWLTNMGCYHQELEKQLAEYLEVPYVSLMVNGHMALEMAIQSFEFPSGAEVITSPFTFISTTHAIVRSGLTPVFCDVKESDGTIDEAKIEALITENTVAIVPVHVYGNICNVEEIERVANKHGLKVIYDAAHAFGEKYKGKSVAAFGDASCFSFHATKVFNTIEGGAVTFHNSEMYEKLYNLKNFGIRGEEVVESIGANAKLNEFSAIMGICNLKHIDEEITKRQEKYNHYLRRINETEGLTVFCRNGNSSKVERNYAYFPIVVESTYGANRDDIYNMLKENNIFSRKYFYPLTCNQICYRSMYGDADVPVSKNLSDRVLVLPFYADIQIRQIDRIVDCLKQFVTRK